MGIRTDLKNFMEAIKFYTHAGRVIVGLKLLLDFTCFMAYIGI